MSRVVSFPTRRPPAPVLAVGSGKGGVGKTWLSASLARAFAERGERVLLVDCDLGLANIDIQLAVTPERDLSHVVSGAVTLQEAVEPIAGGVTRPGGFDLIAGQSGSQGLADMAPGRIQALAAGITALSFSYDRVVMDLAAGVGHGVMRLAAAADSVLAVAINEPTSLTDAYAFIKLLRQRRPDAQVAVVANRVRGTTEAGRVHGAIARACGAWLGFEPPLAGAVREDSLVRSALRAQTLLARHAPLSRALEDVTGLAGAVASGQAFAVRLPAANAG